MGSGDGDRSVLFMICTLVACMGLSFGGGCLLHALLELQDASSQEKCEQLPMCPPLPSPLVMDVDTLEELESTRSVYTTKEFDLNRPELNGSNHVMVKLKLVSEQGDDVDDDDDDVGNDDDYFVDGEDADEDDEEEDDEEEDDGDEEEDDDNNEELESEAFTSMKTANPAGQLVQMDFKNLQYHMLNEESCLLGIIIDILVENDLNTLLSHHCHRLLPSGVSCVGVMVKGHFSFHTWPEEGVLSLDLMTSPDTAELVRLAPRMAIQFGVEAPDMTINTQQCVSSECDPTIDPPRALWKHKMRGFRERLSRYRPLEMDLSDELFDSGQPMEYIAEVATARSMFQQIDIWDSFTSGNLYHWEKAQIDPNSYEARTSELFEPERSVYLDGVSQSHKSRDATYHESLVQPGMFSHPAPRRVAIVGGGEGATLREVLKHDTVERVIMVEIDEIMVKVSKEFLPTWNSCADLVGSSPNCFDEPRADIIYEDAVAWFRDRTFVPIGSTPSTNNMVMEQFDVVIVDALDPQDTAEFSDVIYKDDAFLRSLHASLTDNGVMVMQLGPSPGFNDANEESTDCANRVRVFNTLERLDFLAIQVYEEIGCGFNDPWSFVVACKSVRCRDVWNSGLDGLFLTNQIHQRIKPTLSGKPALKFFDGATLHKFVHQSRHWETVYCRSPTPHPSCGTLDGYTPETIVENAVEYDPSSKGLVATRSLQAGDKILLEDHGNYLHVPPPAVRALMQDNNSEDIVEAFKKLSLPSSYAEQEFYLPTGLRLYATETTEVSEANVEHVFSARPGPVNVNAYDPILDRRFDGAIKTLTVTRSISKGELIVIWRR